MKHTLQALLLSALVLSVTPAHPSRAENASGDGAAIRIVPRERSSRLIYFDPPHAPYIAGDYISRIDSVVDSISPSGDLSLLIEPATETYARLIRNSEFKDFSLSESGRKLLQESRNWLIDGKRARQPGYAKYFEARRRADNAAVRRDVGEFREALVALFGEANAYDYVNALHVGQTYGAGPRGDIVRSIKGRTIDQSVRGGNLYYPHPDDLDLVSHWRPLVIRSDDDPRIVRGFATDIEILNPRVDRVLEQVSATSEREPFHIPRRLLIARELRLVEAPSESVGAVETVLSLPGRMFEVYAGSLARNPSVTFLLAVEIERVLQ